MGWSFYVSGSKWSFRERHGNVCTITKREPEIQQFFSILPTYLDMDLLLLPGCKCISGWSLYGVHPITMIGFMRRHFSADIGAVCISPRVFLKGLFSLRLVVGSSKSLSLQAALRTEDIATSILLLLEIVEAGFF